jgi:hypothetical protein
MAPGLSADLSGVVRVGDELIQVQSIMVATIATIAELNAIVAGNRGTQVALRFRRTMPTDALARVSFSDKPSYKKGDKFDYRIVLKRGAWGPEHCIVSPEDLDMVDNGQWPEPGSVTTENVDMNKVTRGVDVTLNPLILGLPAEKAIPGSAQDKKDHAAIPAKK